MSAPLKSYIDRILNVLAEIDNLGGDKKEIYKELAGDGYDRTVVSQVVGHVRKKAAKPGKFAEQSALFDLYLTEYEGVGTVRANAHAAREFIDHDTTTGEVNPSEAAMLPQTAGSETAVAAGAPEGEHSPHASEPIRRMSMTPLEPREAGGLKGFGFTVRFDEPEATVLPQTGAVDAPVTNSRTAEGVSAPLTQGGVGTSLAGAGGDKDRQPHSEAADLATVTVAETALVPRVAAASEPIADISKPNPICRDPEDCGVYASWHLTCEACKRAAAHRVAA